MEDSSELNNVHTSDCVEEGETSSVHIEIETPDVTRENLATNAPQLLPCNETISTKTNERESDKSDLKPRTPYYQQLQDVGHQPIYVVGYEFTPQRYSSYTMFGGSFSDTSVTVRNNFIQKVYTILTIQLLYVLGFIALCIYVSQVKEFVQHNVIMIFLALFVEIMCLYAFCCCECARRDFPINFILLILYTVASSYILGCFTTYLKTEIVMLGIGLTAGVCLLISIYACQTSIDITGCGMALYMLFMIVIMVGIVFRITLALGSGDRFLMPLIYSALMAFVFSLYLMYHTQMIIGGRGEEISPDEYILGVILLYTDILGILVRILRILDILDR